VELRTEHQTRAAQALVCLEITWGSCSDWEFDLAGLAGALDSAFLTSSG
jgi:hypothetical protein